jgi:hypothetical protein
MKWERTWTLLEDPDSKEFTSLVGETFIWKNVDCTHFIFLVLQKMVEIQVWSW